MSDRPEIPNDITRNDLGFLHRWGPPTLYRCALESDPTSASRWSVCRTDPAGTLIRIQELR